MRFPIVAALAALVATSGCFKLSALDNRGQNICQTPTGANLLMRGQDAFDGGGVPSGWSNGGTRGGVTYDGCIAPTSSWFCADTTASLFAPRINVTSLDSYRLTLWMRSGASIDGGSAQSSGNVDIVFYPEFFTNPNPASLSKFSLSPDWQQVVTPLALVPAEDFGVAEDDGGMQSQTLQAYVTLDSGSCVVINYAFLEQVP